ncbi:MAG: HEAT repeat domain-containing protein [Myxococcales bacterium]
MALRVVRAVLSTLSLARTPYLAALAATVSLSAALPNPAAAKKKASPPPAEEPAGLSIEEISVMLSSSNADEVKMAIESSAMLGSPDVAALLGERIRAGLPPDLLNSALDALSLLNQPSSSELFVSLTRHRRPSVRVRSVQALVALHSKDAEPALVAALGDSAPEVREAAAEGLGHLGSTGSTDVLFQAFDRGVVSAGRAIGKLVSDNQVPRVLEFIGRAPLSSLTPVFDSLLTRRDISEATKLTIVNSIAELGTAEARGYLEGLSQKLPDAPPRVRKTIDDAVMRIAK